MFHISKIKPKSILGPVKAQKFSLCLLLYIILWYITSSYSVQSRIDKEGVIFDPLSSDLGVIL